MNAVEQGDQLDRAGMTAFLDTAFLPPARQVIFCVRHLTIGASLPLMA
jgi:hypothetical protein